MSYLRIRGVVPSRRALYSLCRRRQLDTVFDGSGRVIPRERGIFQGLPHNTARWRFLWLTASRSGEAAAARWGRHKSRGQGVTACGGTGEGAAGGWHTRPFILPIRPGRPTYTNGDTSLIIHANDAFPTSSVPTLNPIAPCTGITTDNRLPSRPSRGRCSRAPLLTLPLPSLSGLPRLRRAALRLAPGRCHRGRGGPAGALTRARHKKYLCNS